VLAEIGGSAPDRTIRWSARGNPQAGGWQRGRLAPRRPCAVLRQVGIKQKPSEAPGQQSPCRLIAVVMPTLWRTNVRQVSPGRRKLGRGSCGGCARCLPNERRRLGRADEVIE